MKGQVAKSAEGASEVLRSIVADVVKPDPAADGLSERTRPLLRCRWRLSGSRRKMPSARREESGWHEPQICQMSASRSRREKGLAPSLDRP